MADIFGDDFDEKGRSKKSSDFANLFESTQFTDEKRIEVGDRISSKVITLGRDEVFVSTGTMKDGVILNTELMTDDGAMPSISPGETLELYVIKVTDTQVFLSPKPTSKNLAEDLEDAFNKMLPVEGRVLETTKGGFRVNVKGQTAFCPLSQMDQKRFDDAEAYVGKKFEFLITQFERKNIVVSRRRLLDEQGEVSKASFVEDHKVGDVVSGHVTRLEKFGAFVELAPGLDGLVHISELSWARVESPSEVVNVGDPVQVKILKYEASGDRLNISLSMKQTEGEPWENLPASIKEGEVVTGKVTRCLKFGAFVQLSPGVEGLLPLSEMSYTQHVVKAEDVVNEGDTVSVLIKEIRAGEQKMLLSLKDAGEDPWASVSDQFPLGQMARGKVTRKESYGAFVRLKEGVVGLLPKSKAQGHSEFSMDQVKVGDDLVVRVEEIHLDKRQISLGLPDDPQAQAWEEFQKAQPSGAMMGTLGDQFSELLKLKK